MKQRIMPTVSSLHHHRHDHGDRSSISSLHSDILQTHILTRLDGPSLAAASSTSSQFRRLSTEDKLWRDICIETWPSIADPRLQQAISEFPSGHCSFFSDVFPLIDCRSPPSDSNSSSHSSELISAVDIHYQGKSLFSKSNSIQTDTNWFLCSPFRVDIIDPKNSIPSPLKRAGDQEDENWLRHIEDNLTASWILIDRINNRAANISSRNSVKVQRHWLTGDIQVQYTTIMAGDSKPGSSSELIQCGVVVNLGEREKEDELDSMVEMNITEVSLQMLDMEGKHLNGKDSLVILKSAIEKGKRVKGKGRGGEEKMRFEEFGEIRRKRMAKKEKIENTLDFLCMFTGITVFLAFWFFILFR